MAYAFGSRIDDDSYAVTYVDESQGTAVTKGEINGEPFESGGGGGSSDFSTAEVTVISSNGGEYIQVFSAIQDISQSYDLEPNALPPVASTLDMETSSGSEVIDIVMYQGHALISSPKASSISGDIELIAEPFEGDAIYDITGDGTITLS